jgi:hypothetical protein
MRFAAAVAAALLLAVPAASAKSGDALLGIVWHDGARLTALDPLSLRPSGPELFMGWAPVGVAARSPDGTVLALASGATPVALRFAQPDAMRFVGKVMLGRGSVVAASWPRGDRLLVVLQSRTAQLLVVDPVAERVIRRKPLYGEVRSGVATRSGLVLTVGPPQRIGQTRLVAVSADGSARSVTLDVRSGSQPPNGASAPRILVAGAGLAVDPTGARAVVVPASGSLAEVDLRTLRVAYHPLGLVRGARAGKSMVGASVQAVWPSPTTVAVAGTAYSELADASGTARQRAEATGARAIDTRTWTGRVLDAGASSVAVAGETLISYGGSWDSLTQVSHGDGIAGYALDGTPRFRLLGGRPVPYVGIGKGYVYAAGSDPSRYQIVDLALGAVVGEASTASSTTIVAG